MKKDPDVRLFCHYPCPSCGSLGLYVVSAANKREVRKRFRPCDACNYYPVEPVIIGEPRKPTRWKRPERWKGKSAP